MVHFYFSEERYFILPFSLFYSVLKNRNRNNGEVAAMLPTKKAKIAPEKKKPSLKVQLQKQHLPAAVVNRPSTSVPAHPIKLQGPRRW